MVFADFKLWWKSTQEQGLDKTNDFFTDIFPETKIISTLYEPIIFKYLKNSEMKHWNRDIFEFSREKISNIKEVIGAEKTINILLLNLQYIMSAYQNILDIEERIILMNRFKGSEELKAKLFSTNIYNDLLNTSFTSILKLFIEFQSEIEGKELKQKNLTPLIECLATPARGYLAITDLADNNIRNAISHGGVSITNTKMKIVYRIGANTVENEMSVFDFKDLLTKLFDGINGVILAWIVFLAKENLTFESLYSNDILSLDAKEIVEKLYFSTLETSCNQIYQVEITRNGEERKQTNLLFTGENLKINQRLMYGLSVAKKVYKLKEHSLHDSIMVSFHSSRIATSFVIYKCSDINDLMLGHINQKEFNERLIESQNLLMFPINDESRNEFEDNFRNYPDINNDDYYLTEIEDISTEKQKRFKAIAYLDRVKRRKHVKNVAKSIISELKTAPNYGFTSHKVKHGTMDADIIYIVLYKNEVRRGKERGLHPNNDNFIAQIQYDSTKKFPIKNNLIDRTLKKERDLDLEYNWNPNF